MTTNFVYSPLGSQFSFVDIWMTSKPNGRGENFQESWHFRNYCRNDGSSEAAIVAAAFDNNSDE